jgi:hypothetical protein
MTILSYRTSSVARRCDATCHTAMNKACGCICGGRYHGAGSSTVAQYRLVQDYLGKGWRELQVTVEGNGLNFSALVATEVLELQRVKGAL